MSVKLPIKTITRWNKDALRGRECRDHPKVRGTSYGEVNQLLGTSGCSNKSPYWDWTRMGIILDHNDNRLVVNPGDWIIEIHGKEVDRSKCSTELPVVLTLVMVDELYKDLFEIGKRVKILIVG